MIKPTKKHILVDLEKPPTQTESGIQLVYVTEKLKEKTWHNSPSLYGTITAVGDKVTQVNVGNRIAFIRADAWRFERDTKALLHEDTVLAVFK